MVDLAGSVALVVPVLPVVTVLVDHGGLDHDKELDDHVGVSLEDDEDRGDVGVHGNTDYVDARKVVFILKMYFKTPSLIGSCWKSQHLANFFKESLWC